MDMGSTAYFVGGLRHFAAHINADEKNSHDKGLSSSLSEGISITNEV
jgi:hypothetical protein